MKKAIFVFASLIFSGFLANASELVDQQYDILCESYDYNYYQCPVDGLLVNANIIQKHSNAACNYGSSWGFDNRSVWVNNGCRATFRVVVRKNAPTIQHVLCESHDYQYARCYAGGHIGNARVYDKHSNAACIYGRSWGIQNDYLWVDDGCRATFEVELY